MVEPADKCQVIAALKLRIAARHNEFALSADGEDQHVARQVDFAQGLVMEAGRMDPDFGNLLVVVGAGQQLVDVRVARQQTQ